MMRKVGLLICAICIGGIPLLNYIIIILICILKKRGAEVFMTIVLFCFFIHSLSYISKDGDLGAYTIFSIFVSMFYSIYTFYHIFKNPESNSSSKPIEIELEFDDDKIEKNDHSSQSPQSLNEIFDNQDKKGLVVININEAFEDEIGELPLLTIIDAHKIVDERLKNGSYLNFDDFAKRTCLSKVALNRIKGLLKFSLDKKSRTEKIIGRQVDF